MAKGPGKKTPVEKTEPKTKVEYKQDELRKAQEHLIHAVNALHSANAFNAEKRVQKLIDWSEGILTKDATRKQTKLTKLLEQLKAAGVTPEELAAALKA